MVLLGVSRRNAQAFLHGRTLGESMENPAYVVEIAHAHKLAGLVELNKVANPWKGGNISNGIGIVDQPFAAFKVPIKHIKQATRLVQIAFAWARVFNFRASKLSKKAYLAKHGAYASHLEHQPLQGFVAGGGLGGQQLAGFFC